MEPLDYLKIAQRHWRVVVGLIVVGLVAVLVIAPSNPSKTYEATHVLLRERASGEEGGSANDNVETVGELATLGEVPARVAQQLGYEGPPARLAADVTATGDPQTNLVRITAAADEPERAVALANAFGEQLVSYLDEREAQRRQQQADENAAAEKQARNRLAELDAKAAAGGPGAASAEDERRRLVEELAALGERTQGGARSAQYATLQPAVNATLQDRFVVGASRGQLLILGGVVAAVLGLGVAIMLDRADQRLRTKQQAERQFDLPVLAEVPQLPVRTRHRAAVDGYQNDPRVAEAYRSLRTALLLFGEDRQRGNGSAPGRQVVVVTSPESGDGKSTTAVNLAMAYAEAGERVLLVQWDLWRPLPPGVLDADDGPGVSEFLQLGNAPLFVQETSVPGLQLVAAGQAGHQPGGQLDAERRLLEEARALADVVVVDTAPILSASVTRELVTMADVVVLTSRVGRTANPAAQRCAELLKRLRAPTLGVVLVGVPTGPLTEYYGAPSSAYASGSVFGGAARLRQVGVSGQANGDHRAAAEAGDERDDSDGSFPSESTFEGLEGADS